jgi:hypothetical protein
VTEPGIKYCASCGTPVRGGTNFCEKCGSPIAIGSAPEAVPSAHAQPAYGAPPPPPPPPAAPAPGTYPPPSYPAPGYPTPGYAGPPPAVAPSNGFSIASLVLGIVWVFGVGSILAVIFGFVARKQIRESGGRQSGGGLALAGIILGFVGIAGLILWIILIAAVTNSINDCLNQIQSNPNSVCGTGNSFNTGDSGSGTLNSGSTGNSGTSANSGSTGSTFNSGSTGVVLGLRFAFF